MARDFAEVFDAGDAAHVAGLLHDLGKYGDLFQRRLKGKESGLDHWSIGASVSLGRYPSRADIALAIQGHHLGLQWWERDELRKLLPSELAKHIPDGRRLTESDRDVLLSRFRGDGLTLPGTIAGAGPDQKRVAAMLDVRMLFSALTDADYLATERHFDPEAASMRAPVADLCPGEAVKMLDRHLEALAARGGSSPAVAAIRKDLLEACRAATGWAPGLFTLTAPTGAGKTLSTLAFALRHAERFGLHRIIVVMPFLSIIDQTARVYREALREMDAAGESDRYLLEHHSLATEEFLGAGDGARVRGMLAQNWDAPIVITTSVQLLESLFSNSPAACRKLHRLARSLVVFDEVQTLPLKVVMPTLGALSHLCSRYGASVVFSTATQPAFRHLDTQVREHCAAGWQPREIVPGELRLFERSHRVRAQWPQRGERTGWAELAKQFAGLTQVLCIVNLKRHARELFYLVEADCGGDAFHLSTAMCPKHRAAVLDGVRMRLERGQRCVLVATQCVEAGVDLDFPTVFRALGPLDSIAQAAGRCNRNGKLPSGDLRIFLPEDAGCPPGAYWQGTDLTNARLSGEEALSIDDPFTFDSYFRGLYSVAKMNEAALLDAIRTRNFPEVRKHYHNHIIDQDGVNVVVAYDRERYEELAEEARRKGLSRRWVARARPYSVNRWRKDLDSAGAMAEPVRLRGRGASDDWFIYLHDAHYDPALGLVIPNSLEFLQA